MKTAAIFIRTACFIVFTATAQMLRIASVPLVITGLLLVFVPGFCELVKDGFVALMAVSF